MTTLSYFSCFIVTLHMHCDGVVVITINCCDSDRELHLCTYMTNIYFVYAIQMFVVAMALVFVLYELYEFPDQPHLITYPAPVK